MPFLLIDFPAFKPIAIEIGPFAIRWYALAYISGIVFGWLYARSLLKKERLWSGPAPMSLVQIDDFILWVTLGIILGGRTGYVLFYNLPFFIDHPAAIFKLCQAGSCIVSQLRYAFSRHSSSHSGSCFFAEISRTMSSLRPRGTSSCSMSVKKPYLYSRFARS